MGDCCTRSTRRIILIFLPLSCLQVRSTTSLRSVNYLLLHPPLHHQAIHLRRYGHFEQQFVPPVLTDPGPPPGMFFVGVLIAPRMTREAKRSGVVGIKPNGFLGAREDVGAVEALRLFRIPPARADAGPAVPSPDVAGKETIELADLNLHLEPTPESAAGVTSRIPIG